MSGTIDVNFYTNRASKKGEISNRALTGGQLTFNSGLFVVLFLFFYDYCCPLYCKMAKPNSGRILQYV